MNVLNKIRAKLNLLNTIAYKIEILQQAVGRIEEKQSKLISSTNINDHAYKVYSQCQEDGII